MFETFLTWLPPIPGPLAAPKIVSAFLFVVRMRNAVDKAEDIFTKLARNSNEAFREVFSNIIEAGGKQLVDGPLLIKEHEYLSKSGGFGFFSFPMWKVDP